MLNARSGVAAVVPDFLIVSPDFSVFTEGLEQKLTLRSHNKC